MRIPNETLSPRASSCFEGLRPSPARRKLVRAAAFAVPFLAALVASTDAHASGYLTARFGTDHGTPAMPNAYAIYFNPAALGGTHGTTLTGDLSVLLRQAHYTRSTEALSPSANNRERLLSDPTYASANTGDANLLNVLALPFLGVNTDFGTKSLRAGFAVYVPFGGLASWDKRPGVAGVPGSTDGVNRWHNISGQILTLYNTFAFAYAIGDTGLSIGASVSPVIQHVATVRARTADDTDEIVTNTGTLKEGRSLLDATGITVAASAGVHWQSADERVRLGLAYLSQPGFGETRMSGKLTGRAAGGVDIEQKIDFLQTFPDVIRLGGTYRLPNDKVEIRSDVEFVRWSVFDKQCVVQKGKDCPINGDGSSSAASDIIINIKRDWNNAIGYRLGAGYFASKQLELFASGAFTTSAVPKETIDASTIDSFRLYGTLGARYQVNRHLALAGSYNHIFFFPVSTKGANKLDEFQVPSRSPSGDGKYTSQIGFINVNAAYTF